MASPVAYERNAPLQVLVAAFLFAVAAPPLAELVGVPLALAVAGVPVLLWFGRHRLTYLLALLRFLRLDKTVPAYRLLPFFGTSSIGITPSGSLVLEQSEGPVAMDFLEAEPSHLPFRWMPEEAREAQLDGWERSVQSLPPDSTLVVWECRRPFNDHRFQRRTEDLARREEDPKRAERIREVREREREMARGTCTKRTLVIVTAKGEGAQLLRNLDLARRSLMRTFEVQMGLRLRVLERDEKLVLLRSFFHPGCEEAYEVDTPKEGEVPIGELLFTDELKIRGDRVVALNKSHVTECAYGEVARYPEDPPEDCVPQATATLERPCDVFWFIHALDPEGFVREQDEEIRALDIQIVAARKAGRVPSSSLEERRARLQETLRQVSRGARKPYRVHPVVRTFVTRKRNASEAGGK